MSWEIILENQKIRNLIVHGNSNIWQEKDKPLTKQKHFQLINEHYHISLSKDGDFYINDSILNILFCDYIASYVHFIFEVLKRTKEYDKLEWDRDEFWEVSNDADVSDLPF